MQAMDFIHTKPAEPLVPKGRIRGLGERVTVTGEVLSALDHNEVRDALRELLDKGIESLAVCLLWSFRNPVHERAHGTDYVATGIEEVTAAAIHREWLADLHHRAAQIGSPQALPDSVLVKLPEEEPSPGEWLDYWAGL